MTEFSFTRNMPYPPEALYAIAADVGAYASFLPLCTASRVQDVRVDEQGRARFTGELTIAYQKMQLAETFRSDVMADPARLMVRARSQEGPVKELDNRWSFKPDGKGGSEVEFSVSFTMSSRLLHGIVVGLFDYAARKVMDAFEARAAKLAADAASGASVPG